jgi:hypothetical protein
MTHDEMTERVAWLERKMVRLLWIVISASAAFAGWMVANVVFPEKGWPWGVLFCGVWVTLTFIIQRMEFRGAPAHIEFIDP